MRQLAPRLALSLLTGLVACVGACCLPAFGAPADLASRVLVVYNRKVKQSRDVALYYIRARGIPAANLCRISPPDNEELTSAVTVAWEEFDSAIRKPIRACLDAVGRDRILYIVFSYRSPYRLTGAPPGFGTALDQYVADMWNEAGAGTRVVNPYYVEANTAAGVYAPFVSLAAYRSQPQAKLIYSVWRLDGGTPALARGLVDNAIKAERQGASGIACIDRRWGNDVSKMKDADYEAGEWDLYRAGEMLRRAGLQVVEDTGNTEFGTPPAPARCDGAAFYAGWYSLNHYNDAFRWNPGAIGIHLDSESAADPRGGTNWAANAIKRGITVTSGAVGEPFLPGLPHPDGVVHDMLAGANVGDAFLRSTYWLKWMIVNLGDPLYEPRFRKPGGPN